MARMVRWDPFRDLMGLREQMDQVFDQMRTPRDVLSGQWAPPLDVAEHEDRFVIHVDLPGMNGQDIDVTLDQNLLTIRGERLFADEVTEENYHRLERRFGSFVRSISLPAQVDADGIQADLADGVLTVTVPKAETAKPRKIKVAEGARQLNE